MNKTEQLLLDLLARGLFDAPRSFDPTTTDWAALLREAGAHTVIPLVYDSLRSEERDHIPADLLPLWQRSVMTTLWQNEQLAAEQRRLLTLLPFPCVILKGSSSAMNYPKPELRCSGDMDLLLSPGDIEAAQRILCAQGYTPSEGEPGSDSHRVMCRGSFVAELHHAPSGLPNTPVGDALRDYFRDAPRNTILHDELPILPVDRRAVLLLTHSLDHVLTSGLGLRHLCDWAVFAARELSPGLWESLLPTLKQFGLHRFALILARACVEYLGLPPHLCPWCMDAPSAASRALMEDLLRSGNFGRKENRYGQRLFTDASAKNPMFSFLHTGIRVCREKWPVCQAHPILLPVAPFVLLWRYRTQRRAGTRPPLRPFHVYQGAADRQDLFRQLCAFQPEE